MIISSIDLFFSRDCAGGRGPEVDAPRLVVDFDASSAVVFVGGSVVDCDAFFLSDCFCAPAKSVKDSAGADEVAAIPGIDESVV